MFDFDMLAYFLCFSFMYSFFPEIDTLSNCSFSGTMLPSSYIRRLRTNDLINKKSVDKLPSQISKKSSQTNRVDFAGTKSTHAYLPYLHRQKTQTMYNSPVSGQINLVLQRLSELQVLTCDQ